MDKECLARKLYAERVSELMGAHDIDDAVLEQMWENRATPAQAVKLMIDQELNAISSGWVKRYLHVK
jgi:hypothetical protein